ncbi:MAG: cupin domain-containing protein [Bacteroidota bacterium]
MMKTNFTTDIHYQTNAIVSTVILKNEYGTITLFAFDAGQSLSEHTTPFDALFHCVEGNFNVTIGGHLHSINANEAIVLPAGIPHSVTAISRSKFVLTMIKTVK